MRQGQPIDALDKLALATQIRYDSGSFSLMDSPLAVLTILLDQLEMFEPAAQVTGKAVTPMSDHAYPELVAGGVVSPGEPRTLFVSVRVRR